MPQAEIKNTTISYSGINQVDRHGIRQADRSGSEYSLLNSLPHSGTGLSMLPLLGIQLLFLPQSSHLCLFFFLALGYFQSLVQETVAFLLSSLL